MCIKIYFEGMVLNFLVLVSHLLLYHMKKCLDMIECRFEKVVQNEQLLDIVEPKIKRSCKFIFFF